MIVLSIGAHPDDETCAAGTLIKYAQEGHAVYILTTTPWRGRLDRRTAGVRAPRAGPGARAGRPQRRGGHRGARGDLPALRRPGCHRRHHQGDRRHAGRVRRFDLGGARTPAPGRDHHPRHRRRIRPPAAHLHPAGHLPGPAQPGRRPAPPWRPQEVLTWCAAYPDPEVPAETNQSDPADLLVDIRPYAARKMEAFKQHRSQFMPVQTYFKDKGGAFMAAKIEAFRRWPEFCRE